MSKTFSAYVVRKEQEVPTKGEPLGQVETLRLEDLPPGEVLIKIGYSSLNYKDSLACLGDPNIAPDFPHVPGIDLAGVVEESDSPHFKPGDEVLVTGYDLGTRHWGGYSEYTRVPAEWIVPLPAGFTPKESMLFGTAGFTAAQCVQAVASRVSPDQGPVVVTGATGGVGSLAVALLVHLGYEVVAISGKPEWHPLLLEMGAAEVHGREFLSTDSKRPLLSARWAAAVDTVGGAPLTALIRSIQHRGVVAACGLVAGTELPLSVFPFLLRGVTLAGIDSALCPREPRLEIWRLLMGKWKVSLPDSFVTTIPLSGISDKVLQMSQGKAFGRTLIQLEP